jgi:hypothetical protein
MSATKFTNATGAPVADNTNIMNAGLRGPALLQDIWLIEKMAHFDREVIPERRMHAKGWGAHGIFTVTHDISRYRLLADLREDLGQVDGRLDCMAAEVGGKPFPAHFAAEALALSKENLCASGSWKRTPSSAQPDGETVAHASSHRVGIPTWSFGLRSRNAFRARSCHHLQ